MKLKFLLYYAPLHPLDRLALFSTGWRISFFLRLFSEVSALPFRFKKKRRFMPVNKETDLSYYNLFYGFFPMYIYLFHSIQ